MSTKCSIAYNSHPKTDFHFYHECFDDDAVYLQLCGKCAEEYEAHPGSVMVRIPIEIWETIRHRGEPDLQFAGWTDKQILEYVESEVDGRIAAYQKALQENPKIAGVVAFAGCIGYGLASDPREEQISSGVGYLSQERDRHTKRQQTIERLRSENMR